MAPQPSAAATAPLRHPAAPPAGTVLGPHYRRCFACGDQHETGLHLRLEVRDGVAVRCSFVVTDHHEGAAGLAHGGVLASALDEALGSLCWLLGTPAVTAHLEVDYVRPVPVGSRVVIDARCTAVDGRKVFTEGVGRLGDESGEIAVRGSGLFLAVPLAHFERHGGRAADRLPSDGPFNP